MRRKMKSRTRQFLSRIFLVDSIWNGRLPWLEHHDETEGFTLQKQSLDALGRKHLKQARASSARRSSETVFGGHEHVLRQTLMALIAGTIMGEHESPGEATIHVLSGRILVTAGNDSWEGRTGDIIIIPPLRHNLQAIVDSVVLLTVAKRV